MPPEESYSLTFLATLLWGTKELTELRNFFILGKSAFKVE